MDAKADRKQKQLIVHNFHFEEVELDEATIQKIVEALKAFVRFNGCRDIAFKKSNREDYLKAFSTALH
jgi:uncharacterized protein YcaQ